VTQGLTVRQAAIICDVDQSTVRKWIERGHIHRDTHGRINPGELLDYLERRGTVGQRKSARVHGLRRWGNTPHKPQS
jgi:helix-turn-helix protein